MRSWLVIPAMGIVAPAGALALGVALPGALAAAAAGAGLAAGMLALAAEGAAGLAAAALAPLGAVAALAERGGALAAPCLALACIGWTAAELARPRARPLLALAAAALAALLAPQAAALIAIAGTRPPEGARPRWALVAPVVGALVLVAAIAIGASRRSGLGELWFGGPPRPLGPAALAGLWADALGPIAAVAALGGLAALARPRPRPGRNRWPELALGACALGALLADLRAGAVGPLTLGLGALLAALGAARLAAQIRLPSGQAITAAVAGLLLILPPAWSAAGRRARGAAAPTAAGAAVPVAGGARTAGASR